MVEVVAFQGPCLNCNVPFFLNDYTRLCEKCWLNFPWSKEVWSKLRKFLYSNETKCRLFRAMLENPFDAESAFLVFPEVAYPGRDCCVKKYKEILKIIFDQLRTKTFVTFLLCIAKYNVGKDLKKLLGSYLKRMVQKVYFNANGYWMVISNRGYLFRYYK